MQTTPRVQLSYPETNDPNDVPQHLADLATRLDQIPGIEAFTSSQRDALASAQRWTGRLIYNTTNNRYERWTGSAWAELVVTSHGGLSGLGGDDHTQYFNQSRGDARYLRLAGGTVTGLLTALNVQLATGSLGSSGTLTLDLSSSGYRTTGTLSGTVTFAASNRAAGRTVSVKVTNGASTRTINTPAAWRFVSERPSTIEPNKVGVLTITAFGTADADIVAAWAVEE